jgi:hypothetical protein
MLVHTGVARTGQLQGSWSGPDKICNHSFFVRISKCDATYIWDIGAWMGQTIRVCHIFFNSMVLGQIDSYFYSIALSDRFCIVKLY